MSAEAGSPTRRVLVTGAGGFVGGAVLRELRARGHAVRAAHRSAAASGFADEHVVVGDIDERTDWTTALDGVSDVIHCAARVHQLHDSAADRGWRSVGRTATARGRWPSRRQARACAAWCLSAPSASTAPRPSVVRSRRSTPLHRIHRTPSRNGTRERPARDCRGRPARGRRRPAAAGVRPRRSRQFRDAAPGGRSRPAAAVRIDPQPSQLRRDRKPRRLPHHGTATSAGRGPDVPGHDGDDLSTTALLRRTAAALGRPARLLPVPETWLRSTLAALGRRELGQRLCGSLQVEISAARDVLGWRPVVGIDEALDETARHFRATPDRERPVKR